MLRTTITKIKRVCAIAFLPRLLRGNLRYSPSVHATFGKFEKLTPAVQKSVWKSTSANDEFNKTPENPTNHGVTDLGEESFWKPLSHDERIKVEVTNANVVCSLSEMPRTSCRSTSPSFREVSVCCCDDSNRVINAIFGESPHNTLKTDVLGNIAHFTLYDNQDDEKLVSDKRIQLTPLSYHDSKYYEYPDDALTKDNYRSVLCYEVVLVEGKEQDKEKEPDLTPLVKETTPPMYSDLCDVDPYEFLSESNKKLEALAAITFAEKNKDQDIDTYWTDVYDTVGQRSNVTYEPNLAIDENTLQTYRTLKASNTSNKDTTEGTKLIRHTAEELYSMIHTSPYDNDSIVKATTNKQENEKRTQKIDQIEETPIVAEQTAKVEGFNVSPKVLENLDTSVNVAENSRLDEVAKRCLNVPTCKVDETLLKEMEKLGVQSTHANRAFGGSKLARELQFKRQTELNAGKVEEKSASFRQGEIELNPSSLQGESQNLQEHNQAKFNMSDNDLNLNFDQNNKQPSEITDPMHNQSQPGLTDVFWEEDRFDPKHVLTCNETCSINPKPLLTAPERPIEDTESIFEQHSIVERDKLLNKTANEINPKSVAMTAKDIMSNKYVTDLKTPKVPGKTAQDFNLEAATATITSGGPMTREDPPKAAEKEKQQVQMNTAAPQLHKAEERTKPSEQSNVPIDYVNQNLGMPAATQSTTPVATVNATTPIEQSKTEQSPTPKELTLVDTTPTYIKTYTINPHWDHKPPKEDEREPGADIVKCIKATSDQLQVTSEKIHATSQKLHVTSEQLQNTSQQLQATTEILQAASNKPDTQTQRLPKTEDKIGASEHSIIKPLLASPVTDRTFTPMVDPAVIIPGETSAVAPGASNITKTTEQHVLQPSPPETEENISKSDTQASPTIASSTKIEQLATLSQTEPISDNTPKTIEPLPEVNDKVRLSDLLKLVRERNRVMSCSHTLEKTQPDEKTPELEVLAKKKGIPPFSQPRHVTPVFKTPGIPAVKFRPKVCTQSRKKKDPKKTNCTQCDLEILGLNENLGPRSSYTVQDFLSRSGNIYQQESQSIAMNDLPPSASLTDEIILQLQNMGDILGNVYQQGKVEALEAVMLAKTRHQARLFKAKDFEPWLPIPSWPHKSKKRNPCQREKLQCPSDGCKIAPPKSEYDPPCGLKPCDSYPTFPKRSFTVLDYCTVTVDDHKVADPGES